MFYKSWTLSLVIMNCNNQCSLYYGIRFQFSFARTEIRRVLDILFFLAGFQQPLDHKARHFVKEIETSSEARNSHAAELTGVCCHSHKAWLSPVGFKFPKEVSYGNLKVCGGVCEVYGIPGSGSTASEFLGERHGCQFLQVL